MTRMSVVVSITCPKGMTRKGVVDYVRDAVHSHSGAFEPSHPLFERSRSATVRSLGKDADNLAEVVVDSSGNVSKDAYDGAMEDKLIERRRADVAEAKVRELLAELQDTLKQLDTPEGDQPALYPIQVIGEVVNQVNAGDYTPPVTCRSKEREYWKAGARHALGQFNLAINRAAREVVSAIRGPDDAQLFQYWVNQTEAAPMRLMKALAPCVGADAHRDAIYGLMVQDGATQVGGKPVNEEGNLQL